LLGDEELLDRALPKAEHRPDLGHPHLTNGPADDCDRLSRQEGHCDQSAEQAAGA
jgi:hypothetical protein